MSAIALLQSKNSTALSLNAVRKNKYTALSGVWKYQMPRMYVESVLKCDAIPEVCRTNFKNNIVDKLKNGELHIKWAPTKVGFGRYYAGQFVEGVSCGSISTQMRAIKNSYYQSMGWTDFDFEKCHPALIIQIVEKSGIAINTEPLRKYIQQFDQFADQMIHALSVDKQNPLTRDCIKGLITAHLYGGGFTRWANDRERGDENYGVQPIPINRSADVRKSCPLYSQLLDCIEQFSNNVFQSNNELKSYLHSLYPEFDNDKLCRKMMSYYLQTFEHECLFQAYQIAVKKGWIEKKQADLCYDGFTAKIIADVPIDTLLSELNEELAKKTGFNLRMVAKPLKDVIPELCFNQEDYCASNEVEMAWGEALTAKRIAERFIQEFNENICWAINGSAKRVYVYHVDKQTGVGRWYDETEEKNRFKLSLYISENLWGIMYHELLADEPRINPKHFPLYLTMIRSMLLGKSSTRNDIITHVLASCREEKDVFDKNPNLLGFNNGVIELDTKTFREYRYDDYMTLSCGYDYVPVDYSIARNKELLNILHQIFTDIQPDADQRMLYIQSLASSLDGHQYQKLFLFTGEGGNGKGLTNSLMKRILGSGYAYPAPASVLKDFEQKASSATPLLFNLKDKRYVVFTEVKGLISTSIIKVLTGGDDITARNLHHNPTTFPLSSTMFMEFNAPPDLDGLPQEAEYRRLMYIHFPHNFTDDDTKVGKTIGSKIFLKANPYYATPQFMTEMAPIFLDALLSAYTECYDRDIRQIKFTVPAVVIAKTDQFLKDQNPIKAWMDENFRVCEKQVEETEQINHTDIWREFQRSERYLGLCKTMRRELNQKKVYEYLESNYAFRWTSKYKKSYFTHMKRIDEDKDEENTETNKEMDTALALQQDE